MSLVYHGLRAPVRWLFRALTDLEVQGLEHIPDTGPFFLLPNHQSALDPLLIQSICPRKVCAMTKSTQFAHPAFRVALSTLGAFPVRRYRVDPQAVRVLLRILDRGGGVCVYPEGERTWDGTLQPFRRGTLHVVLRAGVPIVPVGVSGTYDLLPRWLHRPRSGVRLTLRFGEPIHFGAVRDRRERERLLPQAERRLTRAVARLAGVRISPEALARLEGQSTSSGTSNPLHPGHGHASAPRSRP